MKRMKQSFSVRLALRFMFLLTGAIILLSFVFLFFVRSLVTANQTSELKKAEEKVFAAVKRINSGQGIDSNSWGNRGGYLSVPDIPYYITFVIYESETQNVIATNDPFLPLLEVTNGKVKRYFEKDFFFDGDLDILYYAELHEIAGQPIIVAVVINMDNNKTADMFSRLPTAVLFMALPVLLLSFCVLLIITKNTINPVVKITKAAKTMTTEKLDNLLPLSGRLDEIDELSDAFNELFLRIKADFDRERQFSSDVSHELNTPLTVISGQANLLLRWGKDNPEQLEKSLLAIKNEATSMHAIIENLLQISRIESGRIKPEMSKVKVLDLFKRVAEEFNTVQENVKFNITCGDDIEVLSDSEMLHQILTILVSNSIKFFNASEYAKEECVVNLKALYEEGKIIIEESDNGPGISEEALPHIFERFYRADQAHSRAAGGSGLGLAIAHTLSDSLGATIAARNIEPHGLRFWVEMPAQE